MNILFVSFWLQVKPTRPRQLVPVSTVKMSLQREYHPWYNLVLEDVNGYSVTSSWFIHIQNFKWVTTACEILGNSRTYLCWRSPRPPQDLVIGDLVVMVSFVACAFDVLPKKSLPIQGHEDLCLQFFLKNFILLASTFRSLIPIWVNFYIWCDVGGPTFFSFACG